MTKTEYVLVPRIEDDAMCEAGLEALQENLGHTAVIVRDAAACYRAMIAAAPEPQPELAAEPVACQWHNGEPPKPWRDEWFIAETVFGDRVVLISLPEEWTYDYKTADQTYIKAERIKRWMQFPDSQFKPHHSTIPSGNVS